MWHKMPAMPRPSNEFGLPTNTLTNRPSCKVGCSEAGPGRPDLLHHYDEEVGGRWPQVVVGGCHTPNLWWCRGCLTPKLW